MSTVDSAECSDRPQASVDQGCPPTTDWVTRSFDLTPFAGRQTQFLAPGQEMGSAPGDFTVDFADVALVRGDGTVVPIYTGGASNPFGAYLAYAPGNTTNRSFAAVSGGTADSAVATRYFLDDHLGTTQVELAAGGWPVWQGQFTPFGSEIQNGAILQPGAPDGSSMPFKFTGKERGPDTGLVDLGARYYASNMGAMDEPRLERQSRAGSVCKVGGSPESEPLCLCPEQSPRSSLPRRALL